MAEAVQSYKKHTRFLPPFHFFVIPVLLVNLVNEIRHVWLDPTQHYAFQVVFAAALLGAAFVSRIQALTVQDRVIRLEMRLRLRGILPPDLQPFLDQARGSLAEVGYGLLCAKELGYLTPEAFASLDQARDEAGKVLWALLAAITKRANDR